jgi:AraC-like DNA-binding protein
MRDVVVRYREYAPCGALRDSVRAFFSFTEPEMDGALSRGVLCEIAFRPGDPFCSPMFADGHASLVFSFPRVCLAEGVWQSNPVVPRGDLIGPSSAVGPSSLAARAESVGVYFRAGMVSQFTRVRGDEMRNLVAGADGLWGTQALRLAEELSELGREGARIDRLEAALLRQAASIECTGASIDVPGMAAWIIRLGGQLSVEELAERAGVSRQHLTRVFRQIVGLTPKMYCRLVRFQSALAYAAPGGDVEWAQVAADLGYTDQSHMIAEFRQFSSLTPERLRQQRWFHPFIELARRRARVRRRLALPVAQSD